MFPRHVHSPEKKESDLPPARIDAQSFPNPTPASFIYKQDVYQKSGAKIK